MSFHRSTPWPPGDNGVWMHEQGDWCAHIFPEDDIDEQAGCGRLIEGECDSCGHELNLREARETDKRCPSCLLFKETVLDRRPVPSPSNPVEGKTEP